MSWNPRYIFLILFTTIISYTAARIIELNSDSRIRKNITLIISAIICLGVLFIFKYYNFAATSICRLMSLFSISISPLTSTLILPVGISFYTFQTLSYIIDVYNGKCAAERHFGYYAAFISFFPQLVAGPIERTHNLLPQIKSTHEFDYEQASYGARLMVWGFFKKIAVADVLSAYVSKVFDAPSGYTGFALVIAALLFSIQIYCDFSGYSDIAIGTASLFGIKLMTNFKSPYFSQNIREFWSRWHISLSTWFRDYVYIPLGGNRVGRLRHSFNLMVTFLLSGLWHGANWTYVLWGMLHGAAEIIENVIFHRNKDSGNHLNIFKVIITFAFCTFAWILFASDSLGDASYIITHLFSGITSPLSYIRSGYLSLGIGKYNLTKIFAALCLLTVYDYFSLRTDCISWAANKPAVVRHMIVFAIIIFIVACGQTEQSAFVYFQF